jgi:hypothetical protein
MEKYFRSRHLQRFCALRPRILSVRRETEIRAGRIPALFFVAGRLGEDLGLNLLVSLAARHPQLKLWAIVNASLRDENATSNVMGRFLKGGGFGQ